MFWICGDSIVKWAAKHALEVVKDVQLGFGDDAEIVWKGKGGTYLVNLLPSLLDEISMASIKPDAIIIHCGTNDLGTVQHHVIQRTLKQAVGDIRHCFPDILILWSDIIPRRSYKIARSNVKLDKARKKVNTYACKLLTGPMGGTISHDISYRQPNMYFPKDEVHLSGEGNAVLVEEWRRAIVEYLAVWR